MSQSAAIRSTTMWRHRTQRLVIKHCKMMEHTEATVCSPRGMSSDRNATRCATKIGSDSNMMLQKWTYIARLSVHISTQYISQQIREQQQMFQKITELDKAEINACYPLSQISSMARNMPSMLSMRARFSTFFRSIWLTASYRQLRTLTSISCDKQATT